MAVSQSRKLPEKALSVSAHAKLQFLAFFAAGEGRSSRLEKLAESRLAWAEYYGGKAKYSGERAAESRSNSDSELDAARTEKFERDEKAFSKKANAHFRAASRSYSALAETYLEMGKFTLAMESFSNSAKAKEGAGVPTKYEKAMEAYCASKLQASEGKAATSSLSMLIAFDLMSKAGRDEAAYKIGQEALALLEKSNGAAYELSLGAHSLIEKAPGHSCNQFCDQLAALAIKHLEYDVAGQAYSLAASHAQDAEVKLTYLEAAARCANIHGVLNDTSQKAFEAFLLSGEKQIG